MGQYVKNRFYCSRLCSTIPMGIKCFCVFMKDRLAENADVCSLKCHRIQKTEAS